jgi:8-oxo-dGTP pyrophosphatase MutT (NUDIX family)
MTPSERDKFKNCNFEELWTKLWVNSENKCFKNDFNGAKNKFYKLKNGYNKNNQFISINKVIENTSSNWNEPEWGFPKGRRNMREKDEHCAEREFREESGLHKNDYKICNLAPFEEVYMGSNGIMYKHIYYIAECNSDRTLFIDSNNKNQFGEIGKLKWATYNEIKTKFNRPNQYERINTLLKINEYLLDNIESIEI